MATRKAQRPIIGPSDAAKRQQDAVDALAARDTAKAAAAVRDPNVDTFTQTANSVKRGAGGWVAGHRDAVLGTPRTR